MVVVGKLARIVVAVVACLVPLVVAAPAQAATGTVHGCKRGWVCMYGQEASFETTTPTKSWYHYGVYNLHSVYGHHWIMDNQYGGAYVVLYEGYNGTGECYGFNTVNSGPGVVDPYMTPINSIRLSTYLPSRCTWL